MKILLISAISLFIITNVSPGIESDVPGDSSVIAKGKPGWFDTVGEDIKLFGHDAEYVWNSLDDIGSRELYITAGLGGATIAAYFADDELRKIMGRSHSDFGNKLSTIGNDYGLESNVVLLSHGIYIGGLISGWDDARHTGRMLYESIILTGIVTQSIKFLVGRARPYNDNGSLQFKPIDTDGDFHSFPSGHTTLAFAMSTIFAHQIDKWWAYTGFYALSTITGAARIYTDQHWLSDVIAGAAIGTAGAYLIILANENKNLLPDGMVVYPAEGGLGVAVTF